MNKLNIIFGLTLVFLILVFCLLTFTPVLGYYLLWQTPVRLPYPVNSMANEAYPCLNSAGDTLYFSSDRRHQVDVRATKYVTDWDIYRSTWNGATWSDPENLVSINTRYSDSCPFLTSDGEYLYFASYRESGGQGKWDLYYATRSNNTWNAPINMGSTLNTASNEISPALSSDGLQLYFASDRPGGQGGFDIWVSSRSDSQSPWQAPQNVSDVNSEAQDFSARTVFDSGQGETFLYLTSDRANGPWDLYFAKKNGANWSQPVQDFPPLNSPEAEGYPFVLPDRTSLLFVSTRTDDAAQLDVTRNGGLDIWIALPGAMTPTLDWRGIVIVIVLISGILLFSNLGVPQRCFKKVSRRKP